jgi:hypothetical protein
MPRALLVGLVLMSVLTACPKPVEPPSPPPSPTDAPEEPPRVDSDDKVRPVYDGDGPTHPSAARLCDALFLTPAQRKASCCKRDVGRVVQHELCVGQLSAALRDGAVTVDLTAVASCESAIAKAQQGCDWVRPRPHDAPAACRALVTGTRATGAVCRSSLECLDGLSCLGVGPTDPGRCAPPQRDGVPCHTSVDPLASVTAATSSLEERHPPCAGYCAMRRCAPLAKTGNACRSSRQCGADARCKDGLCTAGSQAVAGESCSADECVSGLHCVAGKCAAIKKPGDSCRIDGECPGACVKEPGATSGVCRMQCDVRL